MKRIKISLILLLQAVFITSSFAQQISLEECYKWADKNYPLQNQVQITQQIEQLNLANVAKNWLPQLMLSAQASYQSDVTQLPFDADDLPGQLSSVLNIPNIDKDQYRAYLQLNQQIWDGGESKTKNEIYKAESLSQQQSIVTQLYKIRDRVNQVYFGILLQDELLKINNLKKDELSSQLAKVVSLIDQGMANTSDKQRLEVEQLKTKQQKIEIQSLRKSLVKVLSLLTGQNWQERVLTLQQPKDESVVSSRVVMRPELQLYQSQEKLLSSRQKGLSVGIMPHFSLYAQGGYGKPGLNMLSNDFDLYYQVGVRLSWNIGRFYTLKNDKLKLKMQTNAIHSQRETFLLNTKIKLSQQEVKMDKIKQLMLMDQDIVKLRTEIRKSAEVKFQNGVLSATDYLTELNAEDAAKQGTALHAIQYLLEVYNYKYTLGKK